MNIPEGAMIVVVDGEKLDLYRNESPSAEPELIALEAPTLSGDNKGSGARHASSAANPDDSRLEEDSHVAAVATWLNALSNTNQIGHVVIIAPPKALGEIRRHYGKSLEKQIVGEIAKGLTGRPAAEIVQALRGG